MGSIFISYRREDAEGQAGRLYRDLVSAFGADLVFMDVAAIEPGRDFRKQIDQSLNSCSVFLAIVGKTWLTAKNSSGSRRLDDPADFVRIETAAALKRDIRVIPVLVQGTTPPQPDQLPADLVDLAYRNAVELTHPRWDSDVGLLINSLRTEISKATSPGRPPRKIAARTLALSGIAILVTLVLGIYLSADKKPVVTSPSESAQSDTPTPAANAAPTKLPKHTPSKVPTKITLPNQAPTPSSKGTGTLDDVSMVAQAVPLPNNPKRYAYTVSIKTPSEIISNLSRVHYDFVLESNPLSIDSSRPPAFSALYNGWGCYPNVDLTFYFADGTQPVKKRFNMCNAMVN